MRRGYKYEKEMLHWLDGGKIEQRYIGKDVVTKEWFGDWKQFDGDWIDSPDWQYRIAEPDLSRNVLIGLTDSSISPAEKPKEENWLYVNDDPDGERPTWLTYEKTSCTIGKIRMEDV